MSLQDRAHEYLKVLLRRPLARVFWRQSVKKAYKLAYMFQAYAKDVK